MKNLLRVLIFIFACSLSAFSQTTETLNCPTILVNGPAGIVAPNDSATYIVDVNTKGKSLNLEYVWSVSAGDILEGQGTKTLTVKQPNANLTVSVEVKGLPENCPNTSSETSCGLREPETAVILDEFSSTEQRIDKARLDNFFTELQNNPNDQGYIVEKFKLNTTKTVIKQKLAKISSYIKLRGFDPMRITIVYDLADENRTYFWRVPLGATLPTVD